MRTRWSAWLLACLASMPVIAADAPSPLPDETVLLDGLQAPAELIVDHWGIPHIFAGSDHDAYFLQGWNAARDRLWQIDLWRKRGLGRLAGSFGAKFVAQDEAARLLLYRGEVSAIWADFGPEAKADTEAFVAGINAYIGAVQRQERPMPLEFQVSGSQPELWRSEDVVRIRSHGLSYNVSGQVQRARVACVAGVETDKYRQKLQPIVIASLPAGLDPCAVPPAALNRYLLGTEGVQFAANPPDDEQDGSLDARIAALATNDIGEGSNNWVIAASRSASGRPILANDPHRAHALPSLRYIVHLSAPGLDVIGAGEPALPGVSTGHNQRIAFGLTISEVIQEDLYVYDLDPGNAERYRYKDGFEAMTRVEELIPVRGEAPRPVTLRFTRHGPVLLQDSAAGRAYALRTVWSAPGSIPYFASLLYQKAANWDEFTRALQHWNSPPLNHVYADIDGNIGWAVAAASPVRPNWDGLLPVPGDGRYEWAGFWDPARLPRLYNPPQGFVATANDYNIPADFPMNRAKLGYEWVGPSRITRIREVLGAAGKTALADSLALQTDSTSVIARRLIAALPAAPPAASSMSPAAGAADLARAAALLRRWNYRTDRDSAAAALFEVWAANTLPAAFVAELVPAQARSLVGNGSLDSFVAVLEDQPGYQVAKPVRDRLDQALWSSLDAAWQSCSRLMGPDPAGWAWGKLHHSSFDSVVKPLADPAIAWQLGLPPLAMGGSAYSPMAAGYRRSDFAVMSGASVRLVHDVGDWDNSRAVNSPGQSGDSSSRFYGNLLPLWADGQYVPLLFSKPAILAAADHRYRLLPSGAAPPPAPAN